MSLTTVTTIKASLRDTLNFVKYHLHSGVDYMYLFFDDPDDSAISLLNDERITRIRCDKEHWSKLGISANASVQERQKANATYAFRMAGESDIKWVTHIDSDEFLYSKKSLTTCFSGLSDDINLVLFPLMEAAPQQIDYQYPLREISLFKYHINSSLNKELFNFKKTEALKYSRKRVSWKLRKKLATALGANHCEMTGSWLLGHMNSKTATKTTVEVKSIGNHMPVTDDKYSLSMAVPSEISLLHYDCQGYTQWKEKWKNRLTGETNFNTSNFAQYRQKQLILFKKAYERGDEENLQYLYKQLYILPGNKKRILKFLGLLKTIQTGKLFQQTAFV